MPNELPQTNLKIPMPDCKPPKNKIINLPGSDMEIKSITIRPHPNRGTCFSDILIETDTNSCKLIGDVYHLHDGTNLIYLSGGLSPENLIKIANKFILGDTEEKPKC